MFPKIRISLILILLALAGGNLFSQTKAKPVESRLTEATVYLQGAQLVSEATLTLGLGQHELVFTGLPEGIDPQTIQAAGSGDAIILSVKHYINYMKPSGKSAEVLKLEDSLKYYQRQLSQENNSKWVLDEEYKMIVANQSLRGDDSGLKVEEIQKAAEFYRVRLADIAGKKFSIGLKIEDLNKDIQRINNQLAELNVKKNQPSNDIVLKVQANREGRYDFALKYYTSNASWAPRYDIRFNDTKSPAKLDLRADVTQSTGVDWERVRLTLSSGNPSLGGNMPVLGPWFLYLQEYYGQGKSTRQPMAAPAPAMERAQAYDKEEAKAEEGWSGAGYEATVTLADYTTVQQGATNVSYEIKLPQDLPSDGQTHQVFIQKYDLPSIYRHYGTPKLECDAFLIARVSNWGGYDLMPGNVSVYFEGAYVTETVINPSVTEDTIDFSLGRDKKIVMKRETLKDFTKTRTIGTNIERQFGYEITVRNTKNETVEFVLQDQVPVSQSDDIKVEVGEETLKPVAGVAPEYDKERGELKWRMSLKPQETVKVILKYTVKYPKGKIVAGM